MALYKVVALERARLGFAHGIAVFIDRLYAESHRSYGEFVPDGRECGSRIGAVEGVCIVAGSGGKDIVHGMLDIFKIE